MKALRTIVVEDEGAALRRLLNLAKENPKIEIVDFAKSGKVAIEKINRHAPDLLLMDIELKDINAFEILNSLRRDYHGLVIFITAFDKHAIDAFNLEAIDYLLKPYDQNRFNVSIDRAYRRYLAGEKNENNAIEKKIVITEGTKKHYFFAEEILWVEANGYYCVFHKFNGSSVLIRSTLKEVESMLKKSCFRRLNRFSIVNLLYLEREEKYKKQHFFYLKNGLKFKASESYDLK